MVQRLTADSSTDTVSLDSSSEASAPISELRQMARSALGFFSPQIKRIASDICRPENQKTLDAYIDAARALCREKNVPVCDCHANWKLMKEAGVDITSMLSNDINHPSRELHFMFAYELVKLMLTL